MVEYYIEDVHKKKIVQNMSFGAQFGVANFFYLSWLNLVCILVTPKFALIVRTHVTLE
jgi:hypothetical protein